MPAAAAVFEIIGAEHAAIQRKVVGTPNTIVEYDVSLVNNIGFDVQQQDIAFEGDNISKRKFFLNGIVVNLAGDAWDLRAVSNAFGKNEVTAGLPAGVAGRTYFGDSVETAGVKVGFVSEVYGENTVDGTTELLRLVTPRNTLTIIRPPNFAYNTKAGLSLTMTAEKTTTDIKDDALPGVPTRGAFWYLDRMEAE